MNESAISDEQLSAYIDNQLTAEERAEILAASKQDPQLSKQINELQELKEWVRIAYQDPPPAPTKLTRTVFGADQRFQALAASMLLLLGGLSGWLLHTPTTQTIGPSFHELAQAGTAIQASNKVLIHISKMDKVRITLALDKAAQLLRNSKQQHKALQLEVVANAEGLSLLRDGSPFDKRIASLARQHDNIAFLACGIAMQNVRLSEGINEVKLLPQAQQIDAALEQILRRLQAGWAYVRG